MNDEGHLHDDEIAAFIDGGLDPEARRRVEAHLLVCDDCRRLVSGAGRLLAPPAHRARRRLLVVTGLAAAAVLVLMVVPRNGPPDIASRTRDVEAIGPAGISFAPEAPPDNAAVRPDTLVFSWTRAGEDATYRITLSTAAGAIVWSEQTMATSLALPDSVAGRLDPGHDYYWQVDALLPDLRSATTGPRRVIAMPP